MKVNRIFCIGKNYAEHVEELAHLGYKPDGECVVFMKPASAVVALGDPIPLPRGGRAGGGRAFITKPSWW